MDQLITNFTLNSRSLPVQRIHPLQSGSSNFLIKNCHRAVPFSICSEKIKSLSKGSEDCRSSMSLSVGFGAAPHGATVGPWGLRGIASDPYSSDPLGSNCMIVKALTLFCGPPDVLSFLSHGLVLYRWRGMAVLV